MRPFRMPGWVSPRSFFHRRASVVGAKPRTGSGALVTVRDRSLKIEIPKSEKDNPELGRVGIIAVAGFAIGVAWPWLAGVRLVPSPPSDDAIEGATAASAAGS